jgi:V/A-type H+-transporting ATPase subunit I
MAVVDMNEFTLFTLAEYSDKLLKELQKFGEAQITPATEEYAALGEGAKEEHRLREEISLCESELVKIRATLDRLRPYSPPAGGLAALTVPQPNISAKDFYAYLDGYDYQTVCDEVSKRFDEMASLTAEKGRLRAELELLKSWKGLDVPVEELNALKTVKCLTGTIPKSQAEEFKAGLESQFPASYAEYVGGLKDDVCALLAIHKDVYEDALVYLKNAGFSRHTLTFSAPVAELLEENQSFQEALSEQEADLKASLEPLAGDYDKLLLARDYFNSQRSRLNAADNFLNMASVVIVRGWYPSEYAARLRQCLANACGDYYYIEERTAPRDSEDVPIKLKNNKLVSAFEDITAMYSMPRYSEMDPTPILTPFYLLFFGMMVGDSGYGLVLFIGTLFALNKFHLKDGTRKFMQFLFYLSISTMLVGLLYGSMFGVTFFAPILAPDGTYKAIIDTGRNDDIVMMIVLSIAVGVVQVLFGIGTKGVALIRKGKILDAIFDSFFWITALAGGLLLIVGTTGLIPLGLASAAKWMFILSLVGLALTQGRESPSLGGKIGNGIYAVYGITGYVGDLVSYTRLVALALSGAYIAYSFNLMAGLIPNPILRFVLGGLIVIIGQTLNLGLGVLGAYVHTCRLQYVEFFGKFYEGGGRPFKPLTFNNEYVRVTDK